MRTKSSILPKTWQTFLRSVRKQSPAGQSQEVNSSNETSKSSTQSVDTDASSLKKSINSSNLCSTGNSIMMTEPTEVKNQVRAELLVYLNRLRVIHGLTELDTLEVFNSVGATLLSEALEDRALGVAAPVNNDNVRKDDTVVISAIPVDRMGYSQVPRR